MRKFTLDHDCQFDGIFVTHAHHDHMDGAQNVVDLMIELGRPAPKVYKFIDGNKPELERIQESPDLEKYLVHVTE